MKFWRRLPRVRASGDLIIQEAMEECHELRHQEGRRHREGGGRQHGIKKKDCCIFLGVQLEPDCVSERLRGAKMMPATDMLATATINRNFVGVVVGYTHMNTDISPTLCYFSTSPSQSSFIMKPFTFPTATLRASQLGRGEGRPPFRVAVYILCIYPAVNGSPFGYPTDLI